MCKFINLIIDRKNLNFKNTQYLSQVAFLYSRYSKYLTDDYSSKPDFTTILNIIENSSPLFYVILEQKTGEFAGFVYLDNLTGNSDSIHGAEISACFEKKFWGNFTKKCALTFFAYCFTTLNLKKIKAQIYPFNHRVKALLNYCGFKKDGILRDETLKFNKLSDIETYSLTPKDLKPININ